MEPEGFSGDQWAPPTPTALRKCDQRGSLGGSAAGPGPEARKGPGSRPAPGPELTSPYTSTSKRMPKAFSRVRYSLPLSIL